MQTAIGRIKPLNLSSSSAAFECELFQQLDEHIFPTNTKQYAETMVNDHCLESLTDHNFWVWPKYDK